MEATKYITEKQNVIYWLKEFYSLWGDDLPNKQFSRRTLNRMVKEGILSFDPYDDNNGSWDWTTQGYKTYGKK